MTQYYYSSISKLLTLVLLLAFVQPSPIILRFIVCNILSLLLMPNPGMKMQVKVEAVIPNGLKVQFLDQFFGVVDSSSLPQPMSEKETRAYFPQVSNDVLPFTSGIVYTLVCTLTLTP